MFMFFLLRSVLVLTFVFFISENSFSQEEAFDEYEHEVNRNVSSSSAPNTDYSVLDANENDPEREDDFIDRTPQSLPMAVYTIELNGRRNFRVLSLFSEKLLGALEGESKLIKKFITQEQVVFELSVTQELTAIRELILSIRSHLPGLSLKGIEGEKILLELKSQS